MAVPAIYAAIKIMAFLGMPPNADQITRPMDLVIDFRIVSAFTMSLFWEILDVLMGSFWDKLKPHEIAKLSTV